MSSEQLRRDRPQSDRLHPRVYAAMIGLVLWFVASVWGFASGGYSNYLLAVVSGFFLVVVLLPSVLARTWRRSADAASARQDAKSFHDWASGEFDTWQGRLPGANAAVEALLPIAAAAFGMTAFAIAFEIVRHATGAS